MTLRPRTLLAAASVAVVSLLAAPNAAAEGTWATSVNGPPTGTTQGLFGGGGLVGNGLAGPGFDVGLQHGIADPVDFRLDAKLAVVFANGATVLGVITPDFIIRPIGSRNQDVNFGLNFGPEIAWGAGGGGGVALFGVKPGFGFSFGSESIQATLQTDFPIYLGIAGAVNAAGTFATVRPAIAIEGAVGHTTNLFLKVEPQIAFQTGFMFVLFSAGVTF